MDLEKNISINKLLFKFLIENKFTLINYLVLSLSSPINSIYLPHLYGKLISILNEHKKLTPDFTFKFTCVFLLWILIHFSTAISNIIDSKFLPRLRQYIRKFIVDKIIEIYRENYSEEELGGILSSIVILPEHVEDLFFYVKNYMIPTVYTLIFGIIYFCFTNPLLGVSSMFIVIIYFYSIIKLSQNASATWHKMHNSNRNLHAQINETLGNLLNIYTSNQESNEKLYIEEYDRIFREYQHKSIICAGNFKFAVTFLHIIIFLFLNLISFYLFSRGKIGIDKVVSILLISLELVSKLNNFIQSLDSIVYEFENIRNVQNVIDNLNNKIKTNSKYLSNQNNISKNLTDLSLKGDIDIKNLSIKYENITILNDISLNIKEGEIVALTGKIGSGKTSLLNSIMRLLPYQGHIYINGYDIKDINLNYLRNNITFVPQNPKLFNRSIYENISFGNDASKELVQTTLEKYGLDIDLNKIAGKYGSHLSGGQRQIIYLLRCLFKNTPIILLDEPTSSLDTDIKNYIFNILSDLFKDKTVIIISHDPEVLKWVTKTVVIENGKIKY